MLSSLDELLHACGGGGGGAIGGGGGGGAAPPPELRRWRPAEAAGQPYPITSLQPRYYVAGSLAAAKARIRAYCRRALPRAFAAAYDPATAAVVTDRPVRRASPLLAAGGLAAPPR